MDSYIIEEENGNTLDFITINMTTKKLIVTPTSSTEVRSYVVKISAKVSMPNLDGARVYKQTIESCRFNLDIKSVATILNNTVYVNFIILINWITLTPSLLSTEVTYIIDGLDTS